MKQFIKLTFLFSVIYCSTNLYCQTMIIDSLFSNNGFSFVQTDWTPRPISIFELNDGKYLVCGFEHSQSYPPPPPIEVYYLSIIRYNNCGTIDSSYGINGQVKINWPNEEDLIWPKSFLLLENESLLMCGFNPSTPLLHKINSNGMVDTNFAVHNLESYFDTISSSFNTNGKFALVEELENNKIFCVGSFKEFNAKGILLARFNYDGSLDSTYNNNGVLKVPISTISLDIINTYRVNADQLLFTGLSNDNMFTSFLTDNEGEIISTYGNEGFYVDSTTIMYPIFDRNNISSKLNNGRLYIAYTSGSSTPYPININRYLSNGFPDSTYGVYGKSVATFLNNEFSNKLIGFDVLSDDRVLIGSLNYYTGNDGASILLNEFGQIDSTFANNGLLEIQLANQSGAFSKAILSSDNRWVVAGSSFSGHIFARYTTSSLIPHITIEENQLNSNVESEAINYQWYFNGEIQNGETNSILQSPQNGEYIVQVTEIENCGTYSDTISVNILESNNITVYNLAIQPNPVKSDFRIIEGSLNEYYRITDISGRIIVSGVLREKNQIIDASMLTKGIYLLTLSSGVSSKIVKSD